MPEPIRDFLKLDSAGGIVLMLAAVLAMLVANTPLSQYYDLLIYLPVEVRVGALQIAKPALLWINDGLMAIFFFLVGLELKREVMCGELSDFRSVALPAAGAIGGMLVPALIYVWINQDNPIAIQGWAIPAATDIAFALGLLALLGSRVPTALKVFLVSVAIFDDIGAIIIIALFYTEQLSGTPLIVALVLTACLALLNHRGITHTAPYLLIGIVIWVAVLKSGVHATLAGVLLALFIPMGDRHDPERSPLISLEHDLDPAVTFGVLPLFAFANAGLDVRAMSLETALHPVSIGIFLGLVLGKQSGIFLLAWLSVKTGLARLPDDLNWRMIYGVSLLCGIGFTMSLFIGSLAFETNFDTAMLFDERLGIIAGSLVSGIAGYAFLRWTLPAEGRHGDAGAEPSA